MFGEGVCELPYSHLRATCNMDNVFGFNKSKLPTDSEIEELYFKKSEATINKDIQNKLFRASMYDPRKSDIYFGTEEVALKAEQISHKLDEMTTGEFMSSSYPYEWLSELPEVTIYKVTNPSVLKPTK